MDLGLRDKACVVTGGGSGIGAATVRLLEAEGARVLPVARSSGFAADVTDPAAGEAIVAECERRFGGMDVLVNNAGTSQVMPLDDLTDDEWQLQWDLNVMGPRRLMDAAAPRMAERGGGRIVNVSSSSGKRPSQSNVAYAVTKAAELSLSRAYAEAWAGRGVIVNAVTPGPVSTRLWGEGDESLAVQTAKAKGITVDEVMASQRDKTLIGRLGTEDEIAAIVVLLCSASAAANVVGAAWSVDGGVVPGII